MAIVLLGGLTRSDTLRLGGGYGAIVFGVGAAPLQLAGGIELWARLGLAILIGLTVLFGLGALMADVRLLWHPTAAAILLGGGAAALHLVALRRRPPALPRRPQLESVRDLPHALQLVRDLPHAFQLVRDLPHALQLVRELAVRPGARARLLAAAGTAVWLGAALLTGHVDPGNGGLLTRINPAWYLGIGLVLASIAFGGRDERLLAFAVFSLALATTLTPALVYAAPRTQSAAKHIDLVHYIMRTHHIVPGAGIFQAYSAFFAGNAWLCDLVGASNVFGLAAFWPVLLAPMRVVELRFLSSRAMSSTRAAWIAVTLVVLVDCLGGDYFSPQALGYVLALGMFGLVMRGVTPRPLGPRWTAALLVLASLTLAVTHELSPFIVAGVLFVLAVFGQAPYWMAVVVALPAAEWAALEHKVLSGSLDITHLFSPSNFAPPKTVATAGLARLPVVGLESDALLVGLLLLILVAGLGLWRHRRHRWAWTYAVCPAVGLSFIAFNPYGNEGIYRAALFGIPWLAVLAVRSADGTRVGWLDRADWLRRRAGGPSAALLGGLLVLTITFMIGAYAMDGSGVLRRSEMHAMSVFLQRAPQDSFLVPLGYGDTPAAAPSFTVATQAAGKLAFSLPWQRTAPAALRGNHTPGPAQLQLFDAAYRKLAIEYRARRTSGLYLLWDKPLMLYSEEYGEMSGVQSRAWLALLRASPNWRVVDHQGNTYLFRLLTTITPLGSR